MAQVKVCKHGHRRPASERICRECTRMHARRWREKHPDYARQWNNANRERVRQSQRTRRARGTAVTTRQKKAMLRASGEPWPTCDCHGEPRIWMSDSIAREGGTWGCRVTRNASRKAWEDTHPILVRIDEVRVEEERARVVNRRIRASLDSLAELYPEAEPEAVFSAMREHVVTRIGDFREKQKDERVAHEEALDVRGTIG